MEIKTVKINELKPHPKNPRVHPDSAIDKLVRSIKEYGWTNPVLVSADGYVLAGHARLKAAEKAGIEEVPVIYLPLEGAKAEAYLIADNRLQDETDWDYEKLKDLLQELDTGELDLELTGFDMDEIEDLMTQLHMPEEIVEDEVPEPPEEPITKLGDLWILGRHRLLCGDATKKEDVERLMDGKKADSMITDPPYGVDYSGKNEYLNKFDEGNRIEKPITNDAITDYRQFFSAFLSLAPLAEYNTVYIFMSNKELHSLRLALDDCGYSWGDYLVWVKNNHVLGRKDYNAKHEFIVYGWKEKHKFYGGFSTTVLEFDRPLRSDLHPTMKPIPLLAKLINDGLPAKGKVYDPFGGSGSTLIACEQLNRTCYMMEIAPVYCDVIVKRWENFTGAEGGAGRVKRVFISHPFSSDPEGNRVRVDIICHDLVKQGILPISPLHLFSFMEDDSNREEILQVCFRLIDISDEVWIYGDSEGCEKERDYALSQGKRVIDKCGD